MSTLTKQGLRASLFSAMEFGFKAHESGSNLEKALADLGSHVDELCEKAENCPKELLRIDFRKGKRTKVSRILRKG